MASDCAETFLDRAGRRRRRHSASPEERAARDAEVRRWHEAGLSLREIAKQTGWGRGTVERAIRNAPPPNRIIRGTRVDGRPVVTIDGQPFEWGEERYVTDVSPTGIEWGHYGAGPKRLAFTILLAVTDRREARSHAPLLVEGCLERIKPEGAWVLTTDQLRDWLAKSREQKALETQVAPPLQAEP